MGYDKRLAEYFFYKLKNIYLYDMISEIENRGISKE